MNNQDKNTNIKNKARKQCAVNEAPALNSTPSPQVEHEAIVSSENSSQPSHYEIPLAYNINKPTEPKAWNSKAYSLSLFGTMKFLEIDAKADFIRSRKIQAESVNNIPQLKGLGKATWNFISFIYKAKWNNIDIDDNSFFRTRVPSKFTSKVLKTKSLSTSSSSKDKVAEIIKLSPPIPTCPSKEILEKSNFFGKEKKKVIVNKALQNKSYAQVASPHISEILKLKENYPNLLTKKIENI